MGPSTQSSSFLSFILHNKRCCQLPNSHSNRDQLHPSTRSNESVCQIPFAISPLTPVPWHNATFKLLWALIRYYWNMEDGRLESVEVLSIRASTVPADSDITHLTDPLAYRGNWATWQMSNRNRLQRDPKRHLELFNRMRIWWSSVTGIAPFFRFYIFPTLSTFHPSGTIKITICHAKSVNGSILAGSELSQTWISIWDFELHISNGLKDLKLSCVFPISIFLPLIPSIRNNVSSTFPISRWRIEQSRRFVDDHYILNVADWSISHCKIRKVSPTLLSTVL